MLSQGRTEENQHVGDSWRKRMVSEARHGTLLRWDAAANRRTLPPTEPLPYLEMLRPPSTNRLEVSGPWGQLSQEQQHGGPRTEPPPSSLSGLT